MNDTLKNKKRGRPRKFDPEKGIRAARTLFYQDGYTGLGVAKICQSMSITPTSLYAAYQSKYQLFEKVVDEYLDEFILDFSKAKISNRHFVKV